MSTEEAVKHLSEATLEELVSLKDHPELPQEWRHAIKGMIFLRTYSATPSKLCEFFLPRGQ